MTAPRVVSILAVMAIPALLWGFVSSGRNDLLLTTRSTIKQLQKGDEDLFHTFFLKYRLPDGDPDEQGPMFEGLWSDLRSCSPDSVEYGEKTPLEGADGRSRERRQVVVRGTARGRTVTLKLEWVRERGNWYIQDYDRRYTRNTGRT